MSSPLAAFGRIPTAVALWVAAGLAAFVPASDMLGQTSYSLTPGYTLPGTCDFADPGTFCTPDQYVPGTFRPGTIDGATHAQLQAFAALAVIALVVVALRRRTPGTRLPAQLATLLLAGCLALAAGEHRVLTSAVAAIALIVAVPPVWRRPRPVAAPASGRFGI